MGGAKSSRKRSKGPDEIILWCLTYGILLVKERASRPPIFTPSCHNRPGMRETSETLSTEKVEDPGTGRNRTPSLEVTGKGRSVPKGRGHRDTEVNR